MLYFFTLPTDGWVAIPASDFGSADVVNQQNSLGAPSGLQPGDLVIASERISAAELDLSVLNDRRRVWKKMRYTIVGSLTLKSSFGVP